MTMEDSKMAERGIYAASSCKFIAGAAESDNSWFPL